MPAYLLPIMDLLGKRFIGLLSCLIGLVSAYSYGPPDKFAVLASTIGLMYGAYVGGQSYTDAMEAK
jgi:hypothetical protein